MEQVKKLVSEDNLTKACAYLCIALGYSPNEAKEIVYNLI